MNIKKASETVLVQLSDVIKQIKHEDYSVPIDSLGNSTLGQHIRHTLEFFICLEESSISHVVNYDNRPRDSQIEENPEFALSTIQRIIEFVNSSQQNLDLKLEINYDLEKEDILEIASNFQRELVYNVEHAIHHMAILKIGLTEITPYIKLPDGFGVSVSTMRFRMQQSEEA